MAVEGVMVSYNYSEDGELANILTVSASGIRFSNRWVLTHGSILSPLKEAKVIQNTKGKPILNDAFYDNLPEIHVTCEKKKSKRSNVYESVEQLSRDRDVRELEHSSYQIRVLTGRICHVWQCPILDRCVDDILYSWTIGHRDGDVEKQTQLGKALLSVFVLVDLQSDDRDIECIQKTARLSQTEVAAPSPLARTAPASHPPRTRPAPASAPHRPHSIRAARRSWLLISRHSTYSIICVVTYVTRLSFASTMDFLKFDTPKFIAEIEKRPAIWKKSSVQTDYSKKLQQWSEIVDIYKGGENLTSSDYDKLEQQLRQKWRNIRDCFVKTHKKKMNNQDAHNKKALYAFYNSLLFLARENEPEIDKSHEWTQSEIKFERKSDAESESDPDCSSSSFPKNKRPRTVYTTETKFENDPLNESANGNAEYLRKGQDFLEDDDRLFFLSLVKEFKKIPDQKQIQAKLDILKVIQNAQR